MVCQRDRSARTHKKSPSWFWSGMVSVSPHQPLGTVKDPQGTPLQWELCCALSKLRQTGIQVRHCRLGHGFKKQHRTQRQRCTLRFPLEVGTRRCLAWQACSKPE